MTIKDDQERPFTSNQIQQFEKILWIGYVYAVLSGARLKLRDPGGPFRSDRWTEDDWDRG